MIGRAATRLWCYVSNLEFFDCEAVSARIGRLDFADVERALTCYAGDLPIGNDFCMCLPVETANSKSIILHTLPAGREARDDRDPRDNQPTRYAASRFVLNGLGPAGSLVLSSKSGR